MNKSRTKQLITLIIIIAIFATVSYFSNSIAEQLADFVSSYPMLGIAIYVGGLIIATILWPVTLLPVLPVAVKLWGAVGAALLTNLGWTIGAIIAFSIAQRYGKDLIQKLVDDKYLNWIEKRIPSKNLFLSVVLFRIAIPVDFVSYALGLFTNMRMGSFVLATFLGTLPLTFALAYATELPTIVTVGAVTFGLLFLAITMIRSHFNKNIDVIEVEAIEHKVK